MDSVNEWHAMGKQEDTCFVLHILPCTVSRGLRKDVPVSIAEFANC